jgi:hypothetical protein
MKSGTSNLCTGQTCNLDTDCYSSMCTLGVCESCNNNDPGKYCNKAYCTSDSQCISTTCVNNQCLICNKNDLTELNSSLFLPYLRFNASAD